MMKKYIYIFVFTILLFSVQYNVKADYKASAINPAGASCNLVSGSTGYCFYANTNFNSVNYMKYLDTGDEVTVITSHNKIPSFNTSLCPSNYVYVSQYYFKNGNTYYGYYCEDYLSSSALTDQLKQEFRNKGFPESYWEKLAILKTAHPNWNFKAINLRLDFQTAVNNENYAGRSLIQLGSSNNYAYLNTDTYSFNYYDNYFVERDNIGSSNPWCDANKETIAYYMDPRNFLTDMYIFQFEGLSYDSQISNDTYKRIVQGILENDYISKFVDTFVSAGSESGVSPIYLASLSRQEIGNGATPGTAISGTYNGMYNFYNIGASGGENPVIRGLETASANDPSTLRPWNNEYKAIVGGAIWIGDRYIKVGQDTSYFKKWDVVYDYLISIGKTPSHNNYGHQYMTNIMAPSSEAKSTYKSVMDSGLINSEYLFYIPVYNNMPSSTALPNNQGWPNNYLASLTINNNQVVNFNGSNEKYNYYLDVNSEYVTITANPISSLARIDGLGTFKITENTTKNIVVTAQNGNKKTYQINIILTGEKIEESTNIKNTLNNSGIKNNNYYLSGITIATDISSIKEKILNSRSDAIVELKNSSNKTKNTGAAATGDKVTITLDSETKTYEIVIYGDANGDGKISPSDYAIIKDSYLGKYTLSGPYKEAGDAKRDGKISPSDYAIIKDSYLGKITIQQ